MHDKEKDQQKNSFDVGGSENIETIQQKLMFIEIQETLDKHVNAVVVYATFQASSMPSLVAVHPRAACGMKTLWNTPGPANSPVILCWFKRPSRLSLSYMHIHSPFGSLGMPC